MRQQNVQTIQTLVDLWNAGERNLSEMYFDPAIELESPFSSVVGVPYRGHAGIEQWTRDVDEQFSEWRLRLDDVRDLADEVIAIGGVQGRGRASGVVFAFPAAVVASFASGGVITRIRIYLDIEEALEAVGLEG